MKKPDWISDDEEEEKDKSDSMDKEEKMKFFDSVKLQNLLRRRFEYGDITQNASERQIRRLMVSKNKVNMILSHEQGCTKVSAEILYYLARINILSY